MATTDPGPSKPHPPAGGWVCARCSKAQTGRPKGRAKDGSQLCVDCVRAVLERQRLAKLARVTEVKPEVHAPDGPMTRRRAELLRAKLPEEPLPEDDFELDEDLYQLEPEPVVAPPPRPVIKRPPCPVCGFDMTGTEGNECPECAATVPPAPDPHAPAESDRQRLSPLAIGLISGLVAGVGAAAAWFVF